MAAMILLLLTAGILYALVSRSTETFREYGIWNFITNPEWDPRPATEEYGAMSFILGTLYTAFLLFFSVSSLCPVFFCRGPFQRGVKYLLAGIPSIIYGLWGFYTIRPLIIDLGINAQGFGIFLSSVVLAIMIIPYASSLSTVPSSISGIVASYILALGRALGETMAVTMLIGNTDRIPRGLRDTGNTMASVIANQFGEADGLKLSSLIAIGLLLFVITAIINIIAKLIIKRVSRL